MTEPLRDRLQAHLTAAMKERDQVATAALRSALSAIANAEALEVRHALTSTGGPIAGALDGVGAAEAPRRELSDGDVAAAISAEIADRRVSAEEYEHLGQPVDAQRLRAEAEILSAYASAEDAASGAT